MALGNRNACSRLDLGPDQAVVILLRLPVGAEAEEEEEEKEEVAHGVRVCFGVGKGVWSKRRIVKESIPKALVSR